MGLHVVNNLAIDTPHCDFRKIDGNTLLLRGGGTRRSHMHVHMLVWKGNILWSIGLGMRLQQCLAVAHDWFPICTTGAQHKTLQERALPSLEAIWRDTRQGACNMLW